MNFAASPKTETTKFPTRVKQKQKAQHQKLIQAKRGSQTRKNAILRENFMTRISFIFLLSFIFNLNFGIFHLPASEVLASPEFDRKFTVTGYYSPLPNQDFYVTGGYETEKRLNGEGIAGADGTGVFPGMIAAPQSYAFGTKICLENYGCGVVHDRGGAIVEQGKRDLAKHDRLDLWMGYGEEGLLRALALGVQTLEGKLYGPHSNIQTHVNFQAITPVEQLLNLPEKKQFTNNLYQGSRNQNMVQELQKSLFELGFYSGEISGVFDPALEDAIFNFQKRYFVVQNRSDQGAGGFGPKTRKKLSEILHKKIIQEAVQAEWEKFHFEKDLTKGHRSADILKLQEILIIEEFMNHVPTGYFGRVTKQALVDFQLHHQIIQSKNERGAGRVGPATREVLNQIVAKQKDDFSAEKSRILSYKRQKNDLQYLAGNPAKNYLALR